MSGTFTSADDPQALAGKISGEMQPGGRAFTAQWVRPVGPDSGSFQTLLTLSRDGLILVGYLWTEETEPTSFVLHRAVNGELAQLLDDDSVTGNGASAQQQPPATTSVSAGHVGTGTEMRPPAATSAVFPASPFNGMQITYSVAGASLADPTDTSGFTTGRTLKGHITGNALTVSGTVRVGGLGAAVTVSVWAGDQKKEERLQVKNQDDSGNPTSFSVTIPVAPGVQTGGFTVNMAGQYTMGGGHRGLFVKGEFLPAAATSGQSNAATTALSSGFTDLTGQLSSAQVTDVRHALNMLTLQHDLKLAVVFSGPLSAAQAGTEAGQHRDQLVATGMLPAKSGLLLYSSDGARGYSRSPDFDGQWPLALVKQAWEDSASVGGLANRVAAQLRRLRELLSASK